MSRIAGFSVALFACASAFAAEMPKEREFVNSLGMKFLRVEPGEFIMGAGEQPPKTRDEWLLRDYDEAPAHRVRLSKPFYLGACEVTNADYEQFDPDHKQARGLFGASKTDAEPVTMVTWDNAVKFCDWLSRKEGRPYRLPTEAEWEYACRAGAASRYSTGDALTAKQANIGVAPDGKTQQKTVPVGRYPPNPWGFYDLHGNVFEWCLDWYGPYEAGEQTDPVGRSDGIARVARGGSYNLPSYAPDSSRYCRSSNRSGFLPEDANRTCGFRVVLGEMPATRPLPPPSPALFQQDVKQTPAPKTGPDPAKPYFVNYTAEKKNPTIPADAWGPLFAAWNHDTALTVCPNGDVLATWYTTVSEEGRELAIAASRLPAGSDRWQPASLFLDVPDVNDHCPAMCSDGATLYHFSNQALSAWLDGAVVMRTSTDSGATWSKPRIIIPRGTNPQNPASENMPVAAFQADDGALVLSLDARARGGRSSCLAVSADKGGSWRLSKGLISGQHAAIAQLADGAILGFGRAPNPMPVSRSRDFGETWAVADTPFRGISVGQKAAALRLAGGDLLLCAPDVARYVGGGTFAALSRDGAQSWPHLRKVDGVGGYLSVAQAPNGVIHLFGSRMTCVAFNEAWLKEGKPVPTTAPASASAPVK